MALGTPVAIGSAHSSAGTSAVQSAAATAAVPAGATAFASIGSSSTNRATPTVTDDLGNTWNVAVAEPHSAQGVNSYIAWLYAPAGLASGFTLTATWPTSVSSTRAIHLGYFTGHGEVDQISSRESTAAGSAWTSNATSATTVGGCVAIGTGFMGTTSSLSNTTGSSPAFTELTDTVAGSRTMATVYAAGIGAATAVTAGGTWANSSNWTGAVAVFREVAGAGDQAVTGAGGIASAEAFGTPTVTRGAVAVAPAGIAGAEAFGTPTVTAGPVDIAPAGIASAEAFGVPDVSVIPASSILPTGIASEEAFGSPTISAGPTTVAPAGITSGAVFGAPTLTGGAMTPHGSRALLGVGE